jgi:hypothetical protein
MSRTASDSGGIDGPEAGEGCDALADGGAGARFRVVHSCALISPPAVSTM